MSQIGHESKFFSLEEAERLLPLVRKITQGHVEAASPIQTRLDTLLSNDPRRAALERLFEAHIEQWRGKIERLGATTTGLWVVEFDVGSGFLNWRYPELRVGHFREQSATIRKKLSDYIEENDPDWAL